MTEALDSSPEMNEGMDIILEYDHFNQRDDRYQNIRNHFSELTGICWFACAVMGAQALSPEKPKSQIFRKMANSTYRVTKNDAIGVLAQLRQEGKDTSTFWKEGQLTFINEKTGGLYLGFFLNHPEEFANFTNKIFEKNNLNLKISLETPVIGKDSVEKAPQKLKGYLSQGQVPILPIREVDRRGKSHGHVVMVGGVTKDGVIISDPNAKEPISLPFYRFATFLTSGIRSPSGNRAILDLAAGIILLEKKEIG